MRKPRAARFAGWRPALTCLALLGVLLVPGALGAERGAPPRIGFLTGPRAGEARQLALDFLRERRGDLGLAEEDVAELFVRQQVRSGHSGVTHVYLRQRHRGLEVLNGDANVNLDRDGRAFGVRPRLARELARATGPARPGLTATQALAAAATHLGIPLRQPPLWLALPSGAARRARVRLPELSLDPIPLKLGWVRAAPGELRLAWDLVLRTPDGAHWWNLWLDAASGAVLRAFDWGDHARYQVFPIPLENPDGGARSLVVDPADLLASPFGWHDTDGVPGAEFSDTRGNNAEAQDDLDANDVGGARPSGGAALAFQFPLDLELEPIAYLEASVTNLFYWTNLLHDIHYRYGFDEAAGNFQQNNYGRGGTGGDPVLADAQDGSGFDNARFFTPPDGTPGRMEMFVFLSPSPNQVVVGSPAGIAGRYGAGAAAFGPPLDLAGLTADLRLADDGVGTPSDGCEPFPPGFFAGEIALIDRGTCLFVVKVKNAQDAGAVAVVVVNNAGDELLTMSGDDPSIVIPSVFLGQGDGATIRAALPGVSARVSVSPDRDGSLSGAVIAHEYGHGVSNRLTGGSANANCLDHAEQMGEGWSDFHALALTALPSHTAATPRPLAAYLDFDPAGIRNLPYTTDLAVNPQTYADIATTNFPHGVGEVWALMLWEMYWNLVEAYGFDPDLVNGSGGNNLALQLVMDGMKGQPCEPTFVEARDAILMADMTANGGVNQCRIWQAFARRGLGVSADAGSENSRTDGVEAFDVPAACQAACANGIDDDGDGRIDAPADPGCDDATDASERSAALPCDDGLDNDADGRADFDPATRADAPAYAAGAGDPACESPEWTREASACQDGLNNDAAQDAGVDFDGGASIHGAAIAAADPQCATPWTAREGIPACGLGFELAALLPLLGLLRRRLRR